jgi:hypothetical protein
MRKLATILAAAFLLLSAPACAQLSTLGVGSFGGATAGTFVHDTFTAADNTLLVNHTGEVGATWTVILGADTDVKIVSGRVVSNNQAGVDSPKAIASGVPATEDYTVTAWLYSIDGTLPVDGVGVLGRRVAGEGAYAAEFDATNGLGLSNFTETAELATVPFTPSTGETYVLALAMSGTTLSVSVQRQSDSQWLTSGGTWQSGQVNCISATDSGSAGAAGQPGLYISGDSFTTGFAVDEFKATQ